MFSRHQGNQMVPCGTYLCLTTGEFVDVADGGGRLPGEESLRYLRVSPIVALLVGPIAGLLFVIFLPLAVPLFVLWLFARRLGMAAPAAASHLAEIISRQSVQAAYVGEGALGHQIPRPAAGDGQRHAAGRQPLDDLFADRDEQPDAEG